MSFQAFVDFYADVDDEEPEYVDEHLGRSGIDYAQFREKVLRMIEELKAGAGNEKSERADDDAGEDH